MLRNGEGKASPFLSSGDVSRVASHRAITRAKRLFG